MLNDWATEYYWQFHEVARAISLYGDVVHYGYSVNWTTETFGGNILDYFLFQDFDTANDIINMALGEDFISEEHGISGRRRGSNSKPGMQFLPRNIDYKTRLRLNNKVWHINSYYNNIKRLCY